MTKNLGPFLLGVIAEKLDRMLVDSAELDVSPFSECDALEIRLNGDVALLLRLDAYEEQKQQRYEGLLARACNALELLRNNSTAPLGPMSKTVAHENAKRIADEAIAEIRKVLQG